MRKRKNDHYREGIFTVVLCLVLLSLVFSGLAGKKQDQEHLQDYLKFEEAEKSYREGDYDRSLLAYQELVQKPAYQLSVSINWGLARILKDRGEYAVSLEHYDRIRGVYPAIVRDQTFLQEYTESLCQAGDERAKNYLPEAAK